MKVLWFTGLSGSGKTTIASALKKHLHNAIILDGDTLRNGLNKNLGFSMEDRSENIRRVAEVTKLFYDSGHIVLATFISPLIKQRGMVRSLIPNGDFIEIFVDASLEACERRDIKGLYKKAREGIIPEFTGISSVYEIPPNPEIILNTDKMSVSECIDTIFRETNLINVHTQHDAFIGRWCPFHKGHFQIMKQTYEKNKRPLLVFVRDTSFDEFSADYRKRMVEYSMQTMDIPATVLIIPDIKSINWGRGVGYETNLIEVEEEVKGISATDIRARMKANDESWKALVCPGVSEFIEKEGATKWA